MSLTINHKPLKCLNTGIGELCLFSIRYKDSMEFLKRLDKLIEETSSLDCFKTYLPLFAYLKKDLESPNFERPDEYLLQREDIEKLTDHDLEEVAKIIIKDTSYLYKENKTVQDKKEDGTIVLKIEKNEDIAIPQNPEESNVEYFHRLLIEQAKKDKEHFKKMASSFSLGLSGDIFKTYNFGKTLTDQISSISRIAESSTSSFPSSFQEKKPISANFEAIKPNYHLPDFAELHRQQEKNRLAPFKDLSSKMETMIDAEKKTVEFMSSVYTTQVEIANELKSSSDSAGAYAKKNVFFTILIIFLTFISIFIAAYPIWFDKKDETNKVLNTTMVQTNVKLEELIRVMSAQSDAKEQQIAELQKELAMEQEKTSKLLKKIGVKEDGK
jgi:hypothetical protein